MEGTRVDSIEEEVGEGCNGIDEGLRICRFAMAGVW